ncbi:hypothetical protein DMH04_55110 [Kibdelosporangium aridum]|uniref:ParB-like nuclease domain-containing protein n=1 Tax=Kibdelosporangium aridum TaxID=2030 RepID=A0A428XX57_KIBAR|nr:DUF6551 family protein [Kibdelosporangium aridum]RSM59937.1 hypothetical protein DMH04_55110 [Kibdelosporangium aridum]
MALRSKRVRAGDLTVDPRVQRDHLTQSKLAKIRDNYNRAALGTLQVSERPDGSLVILDGWHRWTIVSELEKDDFPLQCQLHTGLTLEQEAGLFVQFNQQEAANKLDLHKVRVTQGEPMAVAIDEAVHANGWAVGQGDGKIRAILALEKVYYTGEGLHEGHGKKLVADTLRVITTAWGRDDSKAVDQNILKAVGQFLFLVEKRWTDETTGRELDHDALAAAMAGLKKGPAGWLAACRGQAEGSAKTLRSVLLHELLTLYNKGRRTGRLPAALITG